MPCSVRAHCSAPPLRLRCGAVLCLCCVLLGLPSQAFALTRSLPQCSLTLGSQLSFSPNRPGDANQPLLIASLISSQSRSWASSPSGVSPEVSS